MPDNLVRRRFTVTRRAALTGLGVGGVGLAMATAVKPALAQEATPMPTAGHPIVGTWIIDRDTTTTDEVPVVVSFTSDGAFIDAHQGVNGIWEATGPRSAAMTIIPFAVDNTGYQVVRATWEIDESGDSMSGPANVTVVSADGTVMAAIDISSTATRLKVDPMDNAGTALAGFPTWTPQPAEVATPTT